MLSSRTSFLRVPITNLITRHSQSTRQRTSSPFRNYSDTSPGSSTSTPAKDETLKTSKKSSEETAPKKKTQAELDQELLAKLQGHEDDGGAAGIEYEDGKPVSMKRSVKNNMFRYI